MFARCSSLLLILLVGEVYWGLLLKRQSTNARLELNIRKCLTFAPHITFSFLSSLGVLDVESIKINRLICAAVDWLKYEQFWQCPGHHNSVAEVSSISLESSSSDKVEWKINKDDEDEAQVQRQKNEMEHNEVEKHIFGEAQQVIHGCCRFWNIVKRCSKSLNKSLSLSPRHW